MARPIRATVRLAAFRNNLEVARRRAPAARHLAVLKANAYGHGLRRAVRGLASGADGFAVLELEAAQQLRSLGVAQRIVLLEGFFEPSELPLIAELDLAVVVHCEEQLRMLEQDALRQPLDVLVKINTGMNRLGFPPDALRRVVARLHACGRMRSLTIMTHFANADEPAGIADALAVFDAAVSGISAEVSLANSATVLRYPEAARGWTRVGLMLYGVSPFTEAAAKSLGLVPAMTLESALISVREIEPGASVGYGSAFIAERRMRMGVVACGYADGYPRHAPSGTPVLVAGRRTRTLGRVSMDMLSVDLDPVPDAQVGTRVVLWGEGLPVEEVARAAGTVSYEMLCALAPRVPVVEVE
jgi:alanine racemase